MSFRISTTVLRARHIAVPSTLHSRAFHSPYTVLGDSPLTSHPKENTISSAYEKHYDHASEPVCHSGLRTYVVSEPDAHSRHYQVPAGAYPTSAPYVNFNSTSAPDITGRQYSSTSADLLAHETTTAAAPRNASGVGESAAVRNASAPGMLWRGGYGGLGLMDRQGTTPGTGRLADRNPPPDGSAAEKYSKAGIKEAWKLRK